MSSRRIICPSCQTALNLPASAVGRHCRCLKCGNGFDVPGQYPLPTTLHTEGTGTEPSVPPPAPAVLLTDVPEENKVPQRHHQCGNPFLLPWILAGVAVVFGGGLLLVVALIAGASKSAGTSSDGGSGDGPTKDVAVGEEVRFGDLGVTVYSARVVAWGSMSSGGHPHVHPPDFVVVLTLTSHNPNRELSVQGQTGHCSLADDVGNTYGEMQAKSEGGFTNTINGQIQPGQPRRVRSGEPANDIVVFRKPVPGASAVTLTLDATRYGGQGKIRVRVPANVWQEQKR